MSVQHCAPSAYADRLERQPSRSPDAEVVGFESLLRSRSEPGRISRLVEAAIIPELVHADFAAGSSRGDHDWTATEIGPLVETALRGKPDDAAARAEAVHRGGVAMDLVFLELLGPAASRLVEMEAVGTISGVELTIALWHLQLAMRRAIPSFQGVVPAQPNGRRILVLLAPGEQHSFSLSMLAEFLLRAGWGVAGGPGLPIAESAALASRQWFDVIAFTADAAQAGDALQRAATTIRNRSRNRGTGVLAVGRATGMSSPGIDGVAVDARQAVAMAERLADRATSAA